MDQVKIGRFIAALRKEKGLTQQLLADRLGVTQKSVSRWETARNMPDLSLLQTLAEELGVTVSELLDGARSEVEEKSADEAIYQVIEYTAHTKEKGVFTTGEVYFLTGVILALIVLLLLVGAFAQMQTIPLAVLGLAGLVAVLRLVFGRCPGCKKVLPLLPSKSGTCPYCGMKLK